METKNFQALWRFSFSQVHFWRVQRDVLKLLFGYPFYLKPSIFPCKFLSLSRASLYVNSCFPDSLEALGVLERAIRYLLISFTPYISIFSFSKDLLTVFVFSQRLLLSFILATCQHQAIHNGWLLHVLLNHLKKAMISSMIDLLTPFTFVVLIIPIRHSW